MIPSWFTAHHALRRAILVDALALIGCRLEDTHLHDYCEAMLWLWAPNSNNPMSFEKICVSLRMDPEMILERVGMALLNEVTIDSSVHRMGVGDWKGAEL